MTKEEAIEGNAEEKNEQEEKTKMSIAGFLKIITGTGVVLFVTKYMRRIFDIIALVLFVTGITKLLSPYYAWAEYVGNNIGIFVVAVVSGMFLLASLIGKKKVKLIESYEYSRVWHTVRFVRENPLTIVTASGMLSLVIFLVIQAAKVATC